MWLMVYKSGDNLVQVLFCEGIEHFKTFLKGGLFIPVNLPCKTQGNSKYIVHIICSSTMGQVSYIRFATQ